MTGADHGASPNDDDARSRPPSNLTLRIASAAVLAPLALACTYVGGPLFLALCAAAAGGILWEWTALVSRVANPRILAPGFTALLAAFALIAHGFDGAAIGALAGGVAAAAAVAVRWRPHDDPAAGSVTAAAWAAGGVAYAGAAFLGPALLRGDREFGLTALLFLFATVWATDVFAYFTGRAIGGPRLWLRLSPNKTWAGAVGGLAGGVAAGAAVAYASGIGRVAMAGVVALLLSVLAQAGDLFESAVKRRFRAKDASHLIPGHGGLMDRLDGFLVAALAALIIGVMRQGMDAPARGLLLW